MDNRCLIIFVLLLAAPAVAEPLLFCGENNVAPYSFVADGEIRGIDHDLIQEAARRMGLEVRFQLLPWQRMYNYLQRGQCDAGFTIFYKKEREEFAIYVRPPLHYSTYSVFVKKGGEFSFDSVKDLYGKRVGNIRGYRVSDEFDEWAMAGLIKVEEVTELKQNILKLQSGRLDCAIGHHDMSLMVIKDLGLSADIIALPTPIKASKPLFLVLSSKGSSIKDKAAFAEKFSATLETMRNDGTYGKIFNSYLN